MPFPRVALCCAVLCCLSYEMRRLAGRPQTPSGGTARPGTSSGRPGSALRQPALGAPVVPVPTSTTFSQEAQLEAAADSEPSSGRQVMTSARRGQLPVVAGARPASAGLKRPASAAGQYKMLSTAGLKRVASAASRYQNAKCSKRAASCSRSV